MVADTPVKLAPHLQPEYTVLPVAGQPNAFEVAGAIHKDEWQKWYRVVLGCGLVPDRCECKGQKFRGTCNHLKAVLRFVERGKRAVADAAVEWFLSLSEEQRRELWR